MKKENIIVWVLAAILGIVGWYVALNQSQHMKLFDLIVLQAQKNVGQGEDIATLKERTKEM